MIRFMCAPFYPKIYLSEPIVGSEEKTDLSWMHCNSW